MYKIQIFMVDLWIYLMGKQYSLTGNFTLRKLISSDN